ncbi:uncharacterized protein B0H18DRAFT_976349 [Fomitopsis serialis]|uniref:uncharacterized protein n=1 Tax=Fomitopsis serialis TaxID=139415 RepID=UPI0020076A7B|nr:uncharacterized protein B0H18DRAFT_976349 [Neoantrodia serialis]KAH9935577.1 hypothetical protein B0H18DRAFT_976349 [Neoantrodia serialis]
MVVACARRASSILFGLLWQWLAPTHPPVSPVTFAECAERARVNFLSTLATVSRAPSLSPRHERWRVSSAIPGIPDEGCGSSCRGGCGGSHSRWEMRNDNHFADDCMPKYTVTFSCEFMRVR